MISESESDSIVSPYSCVQCRVSKKKCDRIEPACTGCARKNLQCSYPRRRKQRRPNETTIATYATPSNNGLDPESRMAVQVLHPVLQPTVTTAADQLLAERFMDPGLFNFVQLKLPKLDLKHLISEQVRALVGGVTGIQAISTSFFQTVHSWMPIVCKHDFARFLIKRITEKEAELFLLVLSMKLSGSVVSDARTEFYRTLKQYSARVEQSGVMSVMVLQATVLIALYEMGHAIYPDAYFSVSQCARYGAALGIDKTIASRGTDVGKWHNLEEARRVWWAVIVLDRFMNLSDPSRQLVTTDPDSTSFLPIDDAEWDSGNHDPETVFTLGSAISMQLGRFARFAQAAHLLSQVLQQAADNSSDTRQIKKTIFSLVTICRIESEMRQLELCTQMALCYSGILVLDDPTFTLYETDQVCNEGLSSEATLILQSALKMTLAFADNVFTKSCCLISPFLPFLIYRVALMCLKSNVNDQMASPRDRPNGEKMKLALQYLRHRWLAADIYLSLVNRFETLQIIQT
ncbi:hypothetical protein VHEMI02485 [[Torrubiella] hemipterigena]|uniref:Zn(2)-C6 fungal-type domain-containing protein n=1 Tax=[Torrubiella] hemipterigena TaxID=1531966 RepID=A0A0A1TAM8_9HYPO|nr:hypothetical protein VHEMI02485 [[Torrubiella] hemipterigena]